MSGWEPLAEWALTVTRVRRGPCLSCLGGPTLALCEAARPGGCRCLAGQVDRRSRRRDDPPVASEAVPLWRNRWIGGSLICAQPEFSSISTAGLERGRVRVQTDSFTDPAPASCRSPGSAHSRSEHGGESCRPASRRRSRTCRCSRRWAADTRAGAFAAAGEGEYERAPSSTSFELG
jgi:hypothetical protein